MAAAVRIERDRGGQEVWDLREARRAGCEGSRAGLGLSVEVGFSSGTADVDWGSVSKDVSRILSNTSSIASPSAGIGALEAKVYKDRSWASVMVKIYGFAYATALSIPLLDPGCL